MKELVLRTQNLYPRLFCHFVCTQLCARERASAITSAEKLTQVQVA